MEEVLEQLENAAISQDVTDESKSNFVDLYKYSGKLGHQDERRKEILDVQKSNRNNKLDKFRGILDLVNAVEEQEIFRSERRAYYRPSIYVAGFNRVSPTYSNVLMMSEWLIEKPEDFPENWYAVPCPKGVRLLVVANKGITKCYTKHGHFKFEKRTSLPGGNPCNPKYRSQCCVLDCFYVEKINTMYVLDILAWTNLPMTDGETEFRHYWLNTQLAELPELKTTSKRNHIIFKLLPKVPCTPDSFHQFLHTLPPFENNCPPLDGLLFYHKKAHYVGGQTPLVGWLYPYMVPEVLGSDITLNKYCELQKPVDYTNQAAFIEKFEEKLAKKQPRSRRTSTNTMDTSDTSRDEVRLNEEPIKEQQNTMESESTEQQSTMEPDSTEQQSTMEPDSTEQQSTMEPDSTEQQSTMESETTDTTATTEITQSAVLDQKCTENTQT